MCAVPPAGGVFKLCWMLAEGLLLCKLSLPISDLSCFSAPLAFSFAAFPWLPPSSQAAALLCVAGSGTWPFWEDKYFGCLERSKLSRTPAGRLLSSRSVRRGAGLAYVSALVLSQFSCGHHFLPLTLASRTVALQAAAYGKRGLRCRHTTCPTAGSTDIVQGGKPLGRLVEPAARQKDRITHS